MSEAQYYQLSTSESLRRLKTQKEGLTSQDADSRYARDGPNTVEIEKRTTYWSLLFVQLRQYLALLLIAVAAIATFSGFYFHKDEQFINAIVILLITFINAIISAYQDYKSEKTAQVLARMLETNARVLRNGTIQIIPARGLVIGDIITINQGDKVPADCRIIDSSDLVVNESLLTGESRPVKKNPQQIARDDADLASQKCMLFMNTFVVSGQATAVVCTIGKNTQVGRIAQAIKPDERAPFLDEINDATKIITRVALGFIACVVILYIFMHHSWDDILLIASALIVGSIPEGLPAVVTFSLSMSTFRLAQNKILVKKKSLLETLGSIDVLCTDKTGTLTQNNMTLAALYIDGAAYGLDSVRSIANPLELVGKASDHTQELFALAALNCSQAQFIDGHLQGEPEDTCLIAAIPSRPLAAAKAAKRISFEPFSAQKKSSSALVEHGKYRQRFVKGAPDAIIAKCSHIFIKGKLTPLTKTHKDQLMLTLAEFSAKALRNLACAVTIDKKVVLIAIAGLQDPPREHVADAVQTFYDAGMEVKMITGDEKATASAIAMECGFRNVNAVTWQEISDKSDTELAQIVQTHNVFARMSPEFKLRIVNALQSTGHRVAITGDGVNDVPALEQADVGIAVGDGAADIAKEAADLILLDGHFEHMAQSVRSGRTVFSNCRKVINYLISANFAEIIMVFVSAMLGITPFTAIQLLWVNFVTDIFPAMALGIDPAHDGIMRKKPTGKKEILINKHLALLTGLVGLKKFAEIFLIYFLTVFFTHNILLAQSLSFTWLVLTHLIRVMGIRFDEHEPLFNNKFLTYALILPIVLQIIILYVPMIAKAFSVMPLPLWAWLVLAIVIVVSTIATRFVTWVVEKLLPYGEQDY